MEPYKYLFIIIYYYYCSITRGQAGFAKRRADLDISVRAAGNEAFFGSGAAVECKALDGDVRLVRLECLPQLSLSHVEDAHFSLPAAADQHLMLRRVQHHWTAVRVTLECCQHTRTHAHAHAHTHTHTHTSTQTITTHPIKSNQIYFAQICINNDNYTSYTLSRTARHNKRH